MFFYNLNISLQNQMNNFENGARNMASTNSSGRDAGKIIP